MGLQTLEPKLTNALKDYTNGDIDIVQLQIIWLFVEKKAKKLVDKPNKLASLWIRFHPNHTGAYDIKDIVSTLATPSSYDNHKYMLELIRMALNEKSIEVHYS